MHPGIASTSDPKIIYLDNVKLEEIKGELDGYRYQFNGKEVDNETYGTGNVYDYGFRVYNPRLAKFLSVDPLTASYPWYTPYQFAGNKPVWAMDLDGLEEIFATDYYDEVSGKTTRVYHYNRQAKEEDLGKIQYKYSDGTTSTGPLQTEDEKKILQVFLKAKKEGGNNWGGVSTYRTIDGKTTAPKPSPDDKKTSSSDKKEEAPKYETEHKIAYSTSALVVHTKQQVVNHLNSSSNGVPRVKAEKWKDYRAYFYC